MPPFINNYYMKLLFNYSCSNMIFKNDGVIRNGIPFTVIKQYLAYQIPHSYDAVDHQLISFVNRYGLNILRLSLATVFLWFGLLKVLNVSPVTPLAEDLIPGITTGTFVFALGIMEIGVGMSLVFKKLLKVSIAIMVTHLASTFSLLITLQETMINDSNPFLLTLEGEFIIKNLVLIAGALAVASAVCAERITKNDRVNQ